MANFLSVVLNTQTDALMGASCPLKKELRGEAGVPGPAQRGIAPEPASRPRAQGKWKFCGTAAETGEIGAGSPPCRGAPSGRALLAGGRKTAVGAMQTKVAL